MAQLLFTLLGEGTSDDALMPIVEWVLEYPDLGLLPGLELLPRFVHPGDIPGADDLVARIATCALEYPGEILFVHLDADSPTRDARALTITNATLEARARGHDIPPVVPVVPVREMEAWLLIDEPAIRAAAGDPNSTATLSLPRAHEIEQCPNAKLTLSQAYQAASGLPKRRAWQLKDVRPLDIAERISNFGPLRQLPAFRAFEDDVRRVIADQGWPERL